MCRVTRSYVFALSRKQSVPSTGNVYMDRLQPSCVAFGVPGIPILMQISYVMLYIYIHICVTIVANFKPPFLRCSV